jgi:hypothetical protein
VEKVCASQVLARKKGRDKRENMKTITQRLTPHFEKVNLPESSAKPDSGN